MDDKMQAIFWPGQKAVRPLATRLAGSRMAVFLPLLLAVLSVALLSVVANLLQRLRLPVPQFVTTPDVNVKPSAIGRGFCYGRS